MRRLLLVAALALGAPVRADIAIPSPRPKAPRAEATQPAPDVAACGLLVRFVGPEESEDAIEARAARVDRIPDDDPAKEPAVRDLLRRYRDRYLHFDAEHRAALAEEASAAARAPLSKEAQRAFEKRRDRASVHAKDWLKRAVREHVAYVDDADHAAAPALDETLFWLAEMLIAQGRDDLADPAVTRLEHGFPRSPWMRWVHLLLGETALVRGNHDVASRHFDAVLERSDADAAATCARYRAAAALINEGRADAARAMLLALVAARGGPGDATGDATGDGIERPIAAFRDPDVARIVRAAKVLLTVIPASPPAP